MSTQQAPLAWKSYLRWMFASTGVVILAVAAFNVAIDPLGAFGSPRIAGLNVAKPYLNHHRELSRFQAAKRICANVGIFGNSRAEIGLDPTGPAFAAQGLTAFNHSIPGTGINTSYRQLAWLQAANCAPKTLVLGVEFFDFLGGSSPRPLPTLQTDPAPRLDARFFADSVFSITGLRDAADTVALQRSRYPATVTDHGFNPLYNYIAEVQQSGHHALFRQRAGENMRAWARMAPRIRPTDGSSSDDEIVLDALLGRASQANATTYVIIYPYHAEIRLMLERLGLGELFTQWKRLVFEVASRHAQSGQRVEVWDFSGISAETLEAIPQKGDHQTQLAYYWEAGHFKKQLGDLVIAQILKQRDGFGIQLNSHNIAAWLDEDRQRVQSLLSKPSPLISEVDAIFEQYHKR